MVKMTKKKLETAVLDCGKCNDKTPHTYNGYHGVPWSPIYVYKCTVCDLTQHSKKKYELKNENI